LSTQISSLWSDTSDKDTFAHEKSLIKQGYEVVAGTDEAGRGPLAGPVVAACVVLPVGCNYARFKDSKTLSASARSALVVELSEIGALIGIGEVSAAEIDQYNIHQASLLAMKRSVGQMPCMPDALLVDGKFTIPLPLFQQTLIKGDSRSASISAASIVAKVTRDAIMDEYHMRFPHYNFKKNKGYPTAEHLQLIAEHGVCEIHRRSFRPVRQVIELSS
jgi:ribonuclease HII